MNNFLGTALTGLLTGALCFASAPAVADTSAAPARKTSHKKSHAKKAPAAPAQFELAVPDEGDTGLPIDPKKALVTDYKCELGAMVTIFRNEGDDQFIALEFQRLLTRMQRVGTTTGANRFENKRSGLVWIGIPAKGILLDAKHGHQLANECKDPDQMGPKAMIAVSPKAVPEEAPKVDAPSNAAATAPAPPADAVKK